MFSRRHARRTLLIGSGSLLKRLLVESTILDRSCYAVDGVVAPQAELGSEINGLPVIGTLDDLARIVREYRPEVFIIGNYHDKAGPARQRHTGTERLNHFLLEAKLLYEIQIEPAAHVYERLTGKIPIEAYAPEDILRSTDYQSRRGSDLAIRIFSAITSSAALLLLLPLMLFIAVMVKLDSRGPSFFIQERLGINGTRFKLLKFRTMRLTEEKHTEWAADNSERITNVGRWLRRFRLDELPQFVNVLVGDMNLVGPRPHPASNYELFALTSRNTPESGSEIPFYQLRCSVLPGITGWAQVKYRYANNLDEELEKLRYDLYYIKHRSLSMNIRIMFETAATVIMGHSSKEVAAAENDTQSRPRRAEPPIAGNKETAKINTAESPSQAVS